MIRRACARSCSTHHARSSNAAASNSKLVNGFVQRDPLLAVLRFQEAALHGFRHQQVSCFPFRFDVAPNRDRHNHRSRLAALIGDVLDLSFRHRLQCTPFQRREAGKNCPMQDGVEMSYSSKVEMSYRPRFADSPFPSSENGFRTARSCQGRAVLARRSEPLTASTFLDNGHGGKGGPPNSTTALPK